MPGNVSLAEDSVVRREDLRNDVAVAHTLPEVFPISAVNDHSRTRSFNGWINQSNYLHRLATPRMEWAQSFHRRNRVSSSSRHLG